MGNVINILTVIDVETILAKNVTPGTAENPTSLGAWTSSDAYVYMITAKGFIDTDSKGRAGSELTIDAEVNDVIRWELTCPGSGLNHDAIIANVKIGSENVPNAITKPEGKVVNRHVYVEAGSPGYQVIQQTDFVATILKEAYIQYTITFQIMDNKGKSLGFYFWDPFIKVLDTNAYEQAKEAFLDKRNVATV